jgi:hypothetical protein
MVVREYWRVMVSFALDYVDGRSEITSPEKSLVMVGRLKKCGRTSGASWASILTGVDTSRGDLCLLPTNTGKQAISISSSSEMPSFLLPFSWTTSG